MSRQSLDYTTLNTLWQIHQQRVPTYAFRAQNQREWASWQQGLTARLTERLGG